MDENIVYSLGIISEGRFEGKRILAKEEYYHYIEQMTRLEKFSRDEQLFSLIQLNHFELTEKVTHYRSLYIANRRMGTVRMTDIYLDFNRLILNLLSSIRMYLDHWATKLKREFKATSNEFSFFKNLTSQAFDNYFSYRFLSKLRNYSQHCSLPIGSVNITSAVGKEDLLKIYIIRNSLLEDFDWGSIITPELRIKEEKFDILPLIEEKVSLLHDINIQLNAFLIKSLEPEGKNLLALIKEVGETGEVPCLFKVFGEINNPQISIKHFPYYILEKILEG